MNSLLEIKQFEWFIYKYRFMLYDSILELSKWLDLIERTDFLF